MVLVGRSDATTTSLRGTHDPLSRHPEDLAHSPTPHPHTTPPSPPSSSPAPAPVPTTPPTIPPLPSRTGVSNPAYVSDTENDEVVERGASFHSTTTASSSSSSSSTSHSAVLQLPYQPSKGVFPHHPQQQQQQQQEQQWQQQQEQPRRVRSEVLLRARGLMEMAAGDRSERAVGRNDSAGRVVGMKGFDAVAAADGDDDDDVAAAGLSTKKSWLALMASQGRENATYNNNGNYDNAGDDPHPTADHRVVVERPILTEFDFDQGFETTEVPQRTPLTWAKKKAKKCLCSCACVRGFLMQVLPFLRLLRGYSLKKDLPADIAAGLTVGIMHIPQGMAYGQLSTLPPVYGLYTSFFPVVLYFFLGTSRHISIGTFAVVSLMVGTAVDKGLASRGIALTTWNHTEVVQGQEVTRLLDNGAEVLQAKLAFAMAVTFAVGCVQLLLGLLRLGFLTVYLSDPLVSGFTTGAACHVFTSQVRHIFGLQMGRYAGPLKLVYSYRDLLLNLPKTNAVTLIASILCILLLVLVKEYLNNNPRVRAKLRMPLPVELVVVVLGTVISYVVKLEETYGVKTVGDVPVGIPAPKVQQFTYLWDVLSDAIAIGIVAFAISVSMAKILAKKHDYDIDPDQELLAYGTMNITCSFFSSFCAAASLSRSLVMENVGCKTQVTGLVSSALLLVVLLVLGTYFRTLPNCILAAIIVVALKGMFKQFAELKRLWHISLIDFMVWVVAFLATVLLDVDLGLLAAIVFALLTVIYRNQRPYSCLLGQVPATDLYKDIAIVKAAREVEHIKIFRFDSALFFANSENFKSSLYKLTVDPSVLRKLKKKAEKELFKIRISSLSKKPKSNKTGRSHDPSDTPSKEMVSGTGEEMQSLPGNATTTNGGALDIRRRVAVSSATGENQAMLFPTVTDVYFIIIDCTAISYVDSVGVKVLQQVITEMRSCSVQVFLAHCKGAVREMLQKADFYRTNNKQALFLTVHDAVLHAQNFIAFARGAKKNSQWGNGTRKGSVPQSAERVDSGYDGTSTADHLTTNNHTAVTPTPTPTATTTTTPTTALPSPPHYESTQL